MPPIRPSRRGGGVSDLKAPGLKPERRQAQLGGMMAPMGRWLERRRAVVAGETQWFAGAR